MEMASSSKQKIEILSCKNEDNYQIENSKIKNKNIKLPNIFEELFESLIEELPSKENLQSAINLNGGDVKNHEQNISCTVVKETSLLLSDLEDQLSTVLARKRFENGHAVNNMSSLTLSYARAFFAQALATLQVETKKSEHRKEWRRISQNFTEEAAEKYINYLALQMNANRGKDELSEDFLGENDFEELHSLQSLGSQSDEQQLSQTIALTPIANENMMSFDSTPSFSRCTPTIGIKPKKSNGLKSPFLTPALVESSSPRANVTDCGKKADKQFGKKRLIFSSSSYINDDSKNVESFKINDERSLNIIKSDESKDNLSKRKVFVSTLITDKTVCIEPERKFECNQSSVPLKEFNCNLMETPLRKTTLMFTSPQSPPCKRLLFSSTKRSHEFHTSGGKNLPDDGYKITRMAEALHCGKMSKHKQRLSYLNRVGPDSKISKRKRSRSLNSSPLVKCQVDKILEISENSPLPSMPVPSHWAPKKLRRPTVRHQTPHCRRSLVRQFQQLSVNPFMDTPPGSPGSFALLPLID